MYRLARGLFGIFFFPFRGGLTGVGMENVPKEGGVIIAPVHMSHSDPPAMAWTLKNRRLRAIGKEELFKNKIFGWIIREVGAFPVKRGEGDLEALRHCISLLQEGQAVIVFAEGTRGDGETMLPLNQGVAMLAKKANVPVVPVGIAGTQFVMPHGKIRKASKHPVKVIFGEPFRYEDVAKGKNEKENRKLFLEHLEERLLALTAEAGVPLKSASSS